MFKEYYKKELNLLRETAHQFAADNPSLATLLKEPSSDPDTERLLEGFAFLTANIHRELDEHFPNFLYSLAQVVCPDYLRPVPSISIVGFEPKVNLQQRITVKKGTFLDSKPVLTEAMAYENKRAEICRFSTSFDVDVLPIKLANVQYLQEEAASEEGQRVRIQLDFKVLNVGLANLKFDKLRFYLGGHYNDSADLYYWLTRFLTSVELKGIGKRQSTQLPAGSLTPFGFDAKHSLLPRSKIETPAFCLLQEYFLFPGKYLYIDLDLSTWRERGDGDSFSLVFHGDAPEFALPRLTKESFTLFATPAVNLFPVDADPVLVEHKNHKIRLSARNENGSDLPIYSVTKVESIARGRDGRRRFLPMDQFNIQQGNQARYMMSFKPSENSDYMGLYLDLSFPESEPLGDREVLKAEVLGFNSKLATALQPGDICQPTSNTPELVSFKNFTVPTKGTKPLLETEVLWHLLSDLSLNYLSLANADTVKTLLSHYMPPDDKDESRYIMNMKKIDAIYEIEAEPQETLYRQSFIRGQRIRVLLRSDHFSGDGDKYLFGCLLDNLFASSAGLNTFTQLVIEDLVSGAKLEWPIRLGLKSLI